MRALVFVAFLVASFPPLAVHAADASAQAILGAVTEASNAGFCTSARSARGSDCTITVLTCGNASGAGRSQQSWAQYVSSRYVFEGGAVRAKGSTSGGAVAAGGRLADKDVTPGLTNQAVSILAAHKAKTCSEQCPADMSRCGIGTEYPFTSGGKSYVAKIEVHTNAPGGAATSQGCAHPGVSLFFGTAGSGTGSGTPGGALDYLRADWARNSQTSPGPVQKGTCYCECATGDSFAACAGKDPGFPYRGGEDLTVEQCAEKCKPHAMASKCAGSLAPVATGNAPTASFSGDALCFTPEECTQQGGIFEANASECAGRGKCFASEPEIELYQPIGSVTKVKGFANYIVAGYQYLISIVAVAATIMFTWGAFRYLLGSSKAFNIERGKEIMKDAVVGLVLVLGATAILRMVNPATIRFDPVKVYMVNSIQFANTAYCADLGANTRVADAGTAPNLRPYEQVAADPNAFSLAPSQTQCGKSYWLRDAVGSACLGSACGQGEVCVSCADGGAPDCNGQKSDRRVCAKSIFVGTVDFTDKRYPKEVDLLAVCNGAQNADASVVYSNIDNIDEVSLERTARQSQTPGGQLTDADVAGRAGYSFSFTEADLQSATTACGSSGLRGMLVGLVYHEPGLAVNDVAVLSKRNCSRGAFDGYANGSAVSQSDVADFADAIACGVKKGKFLDDPQKTNYWTVQQLRDAMKGISPLACNFSLSSSNAPDDPESKYCK